MAGVRSLGGSAAKAEIARLMAAAKRHGEKNIYAGKRQSERVAEGIQLEASTNLEDPSATWFVTMHDISHGGVAFWSKRDVQPRTYLFVREYSAGTTRQWLPVHVKHRTVGLRGYLVGASFEIAGSPGGDGSNAPASGKSPMPRALLPGWRRPHR